MTGDPRTYPPANEPWLDRPLSGEELSALKIKVSKMSRRTLVEFYDDALNKCRLDRGVPPRARFIQQLVAAWKEIQRRKSEGR
jgi:hypothetical protein